MAPGARNEVASIISLHPELRMYRPSLHNRRHGQTFDLWQSLTTELARLTVAVLAMNDEQTTVAVQRYLDELAQLPGDAPAEPVIRALIGRSVDRLHVLCGTLLLRSYPRLTRPPLNLQTEEMLSSVVDRLLKALRETRPATVRQFFGLANQHMRWELNDLARRLDKETPALELREAMVPAPQSSESGLSGDARRMLNAIDSLPEDEKEVFSLVRIQGMTANEVANIVGVSTKTIQRRLNRALILLEEMLADLKPIERPAGEA
ncbi:MAG TPA: sigma-70 family RNA polymerase sigma factor [Planctomycetaceae bacterium]|nr:sigma-70 family RNA polymerase sigma factor [Planctomycetaceae bacterium]